MRIHVISDVHLEFQKWRRQWNIDSIACDVHILCGDIGNGLMGLDFAINEFTKPVIYVAGNHEFYSSRPVQVWWRKAREKVAGTHIHLLENQSACIDGTRFLGATLWYDLCLFGEDQQERLGKYVQTASNDYSHIFLSRRGPIHYSADPYSFGITRKRSGDSLTWKKLLAWHQISRDFLEKSLAETGDWDKTIVVTHHAPSLHGIEETPAVDLDAAYASNLDHLVVKADLWCHGHVHRSRDYVGNGGGKVVVNARGYKDAGLGADSGFIWNKVIVV